MAGGIWESQNKVRPGVYIRFKSNRNQSLSVGDRGIVTICEPLSWGEVSTVTELEAGTNMVPYTGYDITDTHNRFLQEIFRGSNRTNSPKKVLLYRPTATGQAKATATISPLTATAKYYGTRGNDIKIIVTELTSPSDSFLVSTVVDGNVVDEQIAETAQGLTANDWVVFSGTGALTASTGTSLTGGLNGTVASSAYSSYLTAIEPYKFDIMIYDGSDSTVQAALLSFVERIAAESGVYSQLVAANLTNPDSRFAINVKSGVTLANGTTLTAQQACWWVGGAEAGAKYNESLTYAQYPGAVNSSPKMTNSEYVTALQNGELVFFADNGTVKVEQDINSLVTYTPDVGEVFHKNRIVRLCSTIANDIYAQFSDNFIGTINNNENGRSQFKAAIVGYLLDIQANQGIQNFTPDDVEVLPGEAIDAIVVNVAFSVVDSVEKIYLTIDVN